MTRKFRVAIAGAASLKGKELAEALAESTLASADFALFDDAESLGRLEAVGDEVTFVRELNEQSFEGADFVFFAGDPAATAKYAPAAEAAGASVIDLTGALYGMPGALLQAPWLTVAGEEVRLDTRAVVIAHTAATAIALFAERLSGALTVTGMAATVLEPASEQGRLAMDELHQQTVKLLSFQPLPKDIYDAQTAFNLLTETGEEAKFDLRESERRIERQYEQLSGGHWPPLSVLLAHAPVFHAYMAGLHIRLAEPAPVGAVKQALAGPHVDVVAEEAPSNLTASGQPELLVRVRGSRDNTSDQQDFRIWLAADNLRVPVLQAVDAAVALRAMRPHGAVQ